MNENSQQKPPTLDHWLNRAISKLTKAGIKSAMLDAELILAHTLRQPRTYLHAHGDEKLDDRRESIANARLELRLERTPLAYIIGHREFYGRKFKTTPAALIPRVESETMIDMLTEIMPSLQKNIPKGLFLVDVGTGTGCLGITAKLEWPKLNVTLTDIQPQTLSLAKENAIKLGANVSTLKMNLLKGWSGPIDIILANLPYVDRSWNVSPETNKEPQGALYSAEEGLSHIHLLIEQVSQLMKRGGVLFIESDLRQQTAVRSYAKRHGFDLIKTRGYISQFKKS